MVQIDDAFLPYMYDVAFAAEDLPQYRKWAAVRMLGQSITPSPDYRKTVSVITSAGAV